MRREELGPEGQQLWDGIVNRLGEEVVTADGGLAGPFNAFVTVPDAGRRLSSLGATLRFGTSIERRLSEIAIITVGARWQAEFEWWAHAAILNMMLLERDPVLASLRQYAHEAGQGEGRLVLIAGEAGVGKSVLVERFQRDLPDALWSWGACDGLSTPRPLAPCSTSPAISAARWRICAGADPSATSCSPRC